MKKCFIISFFVMIIASCEKGDLKHADELLRLGDFKRARDYYSKAIEDSPQNFRARFGIALSYFQEAAYKSRQGTVTAQDWEQVVYNLEIASHIDETEKLKLNLACAFFNLGVFYKNNRKPDAAIVQFQRAVSIDSTLFEGFNQLGATYHQKGEYDNAEKAYRRVLAINPDYSAAHFNLGALFWVKRQFSQSVICWEKALALDKNNKHYFDWLMKAKAKI
jgi:tetratricopeptide (TPR) repeat protein